MRLVLQRVSRAGVAVAGEEPRAIGPGLAILVGFCGGDDENTVRWMAEKALGLRIFNDTEGKLNRSVLEEQGQLLVVSNFTLYASCKKGRRPSFAGAAAPEKAEPLYTLLVRALRESGLAVAAGTFGGDMKVEILGDGPVTILLDSGEIMPK